MPELVTTPKLAVISLWAEDVALSVHFYRDVIGLKLLAHHGGRPHFDLGGMFLTIVKGQPVTARDADPARFPLLAFSVTNLDSLVDRLHAHRVDTPWGIESDSSSRWVMFHDPAGNLVELVQYQ